MEKTVFAAGCYTEKASHAPYARGKGITVLALDEESGSLEQLSIAGDITNPSYLDWDFQDKKLYALSEIPAGDGEIRSYTIDENFKLTPFETQTGPGRSGCHLSVHKKHSIIAAASYGDGCLKIYPLEKGRLLESHSVISYEGDGPDKTRQSESHAHQVLSDPEGSFLYVCDLGSDTIWLHNLQEEGMPAQKALDVPPGYGPRHLAFDPESPYVYILCELKPRLLLAERQPETGKLTIIQDEWTVGRLARDKSAPAAVKVHPSGNSVAVSNRWEDSVTVFRIHREEEDLRIEAYSSFSCRGKTPRDISFSSSGLWLLIANQDSSDIHIKAFHPESGLPCARWGEPFELGTAACLLEIT